MNQLVDQSAIHLRAFIKSKACLTPVAIARSFYMLPMVQGDES